MQTLSFTLFNDVNVGVTITQLENGQLQFDLVVLDETGSIGDLNGLFFDISSDVSVAGLSVSGDDITGVVIKEDSVTKVDSYNNVNGEVVREYDKFDAGVQFGTAGIGTDDIRETSFILSHDSIDLTLDMFLAMDFAARLTSVGTEDGSRDGSLKIGGTAPAELDGPTDPVAIANDDTMTVGNNQTFNEFGLPDPLDNFVFTILENDTVDGAPYIGPVFSADGQLIEDFIIVEGSNGGQLQINADGTVDFSANDNFGGLVDDQRAYTEFNYALEGGDIGTISVEVFAFVGGPGDPFDPF